MKQKLTLICVLSILLANVNAQKIGIKAGLSLANAQYEYSGTSISTSNLTGVQAGLIGEVIISNEIYFNSGILFSQKGTKMSLLGVEIDFPINYFEIPLNLAYKYDLGTVKLFAQAGPYFGIGLSAKMKGGGFEETIDFGSETDQIKRLDLGINFGAGIEIKKVRLGINYGLGLTNLSNDSDELMKNGVLSFSVGIFL
ncbi:MAG: porin family protein [Bacteroidales bacterium]